MTDLSDIRTGLDSGEFFLEYLPTISLTDGRCIGAEALIRWRRETGVVPPSQFIPLVENTFVCGLITYWVFEMVAAELSEWLDANPHMHIAINVPPEILGRGGLVYAAAKSGLVKRASQVLVEITERSVPDLMAVDAINARREGTMIGLDDVTLVGGANLAILARSNFDAIKLDKSIIDQIDSQSVAPEWLDTIAALLETSHLLVIAEGVESEQQMITLRAAGIQAAQGFYFSQPIDARALMAFSAKRETERHPDPAGDLT